MTNDFTLGAHVLLRVFPRGLRDFQFYFSESGEGSQATGQPLPFLFTERAPWLLERIEATQPVVARQVFLSKILVNCLVYGGNKRHLIVEPWGQDEIDGTALRVGSQSLLRRDLSREQADEFRLVTTGESPPAGSLAEVFWEAHVTTPRIPAVFEDLQMGEMAMAILGLLNPSSQRRNELQVSQIRSTISNLWSNEFSDLELTIPRRERRIAFKRLMSATIRFASQFNGLIARAYILEIIRNGELGLDEISERENSLIELRYGGCRALEDVNVGLLFGCEGMYAELINDYAQVLAFGDEAEVSGCERTLNRYFSLLRSFRERRRQSRKIERRERRQEHQDYLPAARVQAQDQQDARAEDPSASGSEYTSEVLGFLMERLHERDARKLKALIDADLDCSTAAEALGVTHAQLSRQWRQTIKPNIHRILEDFGSTNEPEQ
jgi:hypothetical protein